MKASHLSKIVILSLAALLISCGKAENGENQVQAQLEESETSSLRAPLLSAFQIGPGSGAKACGKIRYKRTVTGLTYRDINPILYPVLSAWAKEKKAACLSVKGLFIRHGLVPEEHTLVRNKPLNVRTEALEVECRNAKVEESESCPEWENKKDVASTALVGN